MSATLLEHVPAMPGKKTDRDRFDLRMEPALIARVRKEAKRLSISASAFIRLAVTEKLERREKRLREDNQA